MTEATEAVLPRDVFRKVLGDPKLDPNLELDGLGVHPRNYTTIAELVRELPAEVYISEWKHDLGDHNYECHVHGQEIGKVLRELYDQGQRAGMPTLVRVYSKAELTDLIIKETAA